MDEPLPTLEWLNVVITVFWGGGWETMWLGLAFAMFVSSLTFVVLSSFVPSIEEGKYIAFLFGSIIQGVIVIWGFSSLVAVFKETLAIVSAILGIVGAAIGILIGIKKLGRKTN